MASYDWARTDASSVTSLGQVAARICDSAMASSDTVTVISPALACIHRSWVTSTGCRLHFIPSRWHGKVIASCHHAVCQHESTWLRSQEANRKQWPQVMRLSERRMNAIVFVYLFSAWPLPLTAVSLTVWGWQFTSVYLDSRLLLFGYESWILFSFPSGDAGASCYGYNTSWLRETPCEINLTSEACSFCLSLSLPLMLFWLARSLFRSSAPCE